jgi:hypothetical protein
MLSVDGAFERIGSALRRRGYTVTKEERPTASSGDRVAVYDSESMSVTVRWLEKARLLILQVKVDGEWVEFARRGFGPKGLEDTAVDALVRAVETEVAETSTDSG